jgi:hypothetical protein
MIYTLATALAERIASLVPMAPAPEGEDSEFAPMRLKCIDVWQDQSMLDLEQLALYLPGVFIQFTDVNFAPFADGTLVGPSTIAVHVISGMHPKPYGNLFGTTSDARARRHWLYRWDSLLASIQAALERFDTAAELSEAQRAIGHPVGPPMFSALTLTSMRNEDPIEGYLHTQLIFRSIVSNQAALRPTEQRSEVGGVSFVYAGQPELTFPDDIIITG